LVQRSIRVRRCTATHAAAHHRQLDHDFAEALARGGGELVRGGALTLSRNRLRDLRTMARPGAVEAELPAAEPVPLPDAVAIPQLPMAGARREQALRSYAPKIVARLGPVAALTSAAELDEAAADVAEGRVP
jgi:hypothetical protein